MVKSISKGIRIPADLYNLVMIANKGKTFNDIVKDLLIERYSFISGAQVCKQVAENYTCAQSLIKPAPKPAPSAPSDVEKEIDQFLSVYNARKGMVKCEF